MRLIARVLRGLYVQAAAGTVFYVPQDGTHGYPVPYIAIEARSLRERAADMRASQRIGRARLARRLDRAAAALEELEDAPVSA